MFWAVAFGLAAITAALLVLALLGRGGDPAPDAGSDVRVYRDQLDEVERDIARGILNPEEGGRVRTEVARRLLEADRAARTASGPVAGPRRATAIVAGLSAALVVGGALLIYRQIGAPGYPDLPLQARIEMAEAARADRPSQAEAEAMAAPAPGAPVDPSFVAMLEQLREALDTRPDDLRGHVLLARTEARLGNFAAAAGAQRRVIALKGEQAVADDYSDLAEYMYLAADGYVSPEAESALTRALQLDGRHGPARYYAGLLYAQTGRPDLAFQLWRDLLEEGPDTAPWIEPVRAGIGELASRAGVRYDIGAPALSGPTAEDIANAETMSDSDRAAMIRSMVAGLSDRLATEGGPPEDWARLIAAYGVLGETERAQTILNEALRVFADSDTALAGIRAAGRQAGLLP